VKKHQDWFLCLDVACTLGPDIELQTVFGHRIAVLSREVLPHVEARGLGEVGKCADWWLVRRTVAVSMSDTGKVGLCENTYGDYILLVQATEGAKAKLHTHSEASKTVPEGATYFLGAANLSSPTGASAYLMPRNSVTLVLFDAP
jgi:hypothetical protein